MDACDGCYKDIEQSEGIVANFVKLRASKYQIADSEPQRYCQMCWDTMLHSIKTISPHLIKERILKAFRKMRNASMTYDEVIEATKTDATKIQTTQLINELIDEEKIGVILDWKLIARRKT